MDTGRPKHSTMVSAASSFLHTCCGSHSQHARDQPSPEPRGLQRDWVNLMTVSRAVIRQAQRQMEWQAQRKTHEIWIGGISSFTYMGKFTEKHVTFDGSYSFSEQEVWNKFAFFFLSELMCRLVVAALISGGVLPRTHFFYPVISYRKYKITYLWIKHV